MNLTINGRQVNLPSLLTPGRTIITLGREAEDAYNVIALDDAALDLFQCQFTRTTDGWQVHNGQWRTECPKGIRSRLQHACNMCMGRCVNSRPARPTYSWRTPQVPTLLNGTALAGDAGTSLKPGDVITAGNTTILVGMA